MATMVCFIFSSGWWKITINKWIVYYFSFAQIGAGSDRGIQTDIILPIVVQIRRQYRFSLHTDHETLESGIPENDKAVDIGAGNLALEQLNTIVIPQFLGSEFPKLHGALITSMNVQIFNECASVL
jgi:hypothetical protein